MLGRFSSILIFTVCLAGIPDSAHAREAAEVYRQGCAPCHGVEGGGLAPGSPLLQTFKAPPADLTDPLFNSREPAADWFMVVKHGGAALGLSSQMPAYGGVYSDREIHDLVGYLKAMTDTSAYPPGDLNFIRPTLTIKAFPEDEFLLISRYESDDGAPDALRNTVYYARRFATRLQFEVKASRLERLDEREDELELGLKWAFHDDLERSFLMAAGLEVEIPLDGGETEVVVPYFSLAKGLSDAFTFQGTLRSHLPTDRVEDGDVEISGIVHWASSPWPRSAVPGLEAVVTLPFESDDDVEATLLPQLFVGLSRSGHVGVSVAAEVPLTGLDYDYRLHAFLLWDLADGPFWKGW